jgi:hypothetical protein
VYWFRRGITIEVAEALEEIGVVVEGDHVPAPEDSKAGTAEGSEGGGG